MSASVPDFDFYAELLDDSIEMEKDGANRNVRVQYLLSSTEDGSFSHDKSVASEPEEAQGWAETNLPASFIIPLTLPGIEPPQSVTVPQTRVRYSSRENEWQHIIEVEYDLSADENKGRNENGVLINPYVSVDTTGRTERMYYSIDTVYMQDAQHHSATSNFNENQYFKDNDRGGINVGDAGPEGADKVARNFMWTEKWYFEYGTVSWAYLRSLGDKLTGTSNRNIFRSFPAESVLFTGAQFSPESNSEYHVVTFGFQYNRPLKETDTVSPIRGFDAFDKKGWHYTWVKSIEETAPSKGGFKKVPLWLSVEKIYFDEVLDVDLGIGAELPATANIPLTVDGFFPTVAS